MKNNEEYKPKQIFSQLPSSSQPLSSASPLSDEDSKQPELTTGQAFEEQVNFIPSAIEEDHLSTEKELEAIIRPDKKRHWLGGGLLVAFTGLLGWQAVDTVISAVQSGNWLSLSWSVFIALIAGLGITAIGRELLKLRKLRHHFSVHEQSEALLKSDAVGQGEKFCQQLAKEVGITEENPAYTRWRNAINDSHSDSEILQLYEGIVITQQDQLAKKVVAKLSTEAAVLVAVSPLAIADILLVAWRNFKLIDQLADIYGVELGYWSRLKLFKLVLINMAAVGVTEIATDASMDVLSIDLAGKVSVRVAQGFGVGILTARLGIRAMSLLRPIPWNNDNRVRISEIRKALLIKLKERI